MDSNVWLNFERTKIFGGLVVPWIHLLLQFLISNLSKSVDTWWPSTWPLTKGFKSEHNLKRAQFLVWTEKLYFWLKIGLPISIFLQGRWSSFRFSSCIQSLSWTCVPNLSLHAFGSILLKRICSNCMIRLVINYLWSRLNISSLVLFPSCLKRMFLNPVSESFYDAQELR